MKEQTISNLKKLKSFHNGSYGTAINEAIKALEKEPCEDCVSREELRKLICQNNDKYGYSDRFHKFTEQCLQLPSVAPQRPTGEWEVYQDCEGKTRTCTCKVCGHKTGKYQWTNPNFCSNCGADMRGENNDD